MSGCITNIKLLDICCFFRENYHELSAEINDMLELLERAGEYYKAYLNKNTVMGHIENECKQRAYPNLESLYKKLEDIEKGLANVLFQDVDFLNIRESLINIDDKEHSFIGYIKKAKRVLEYLLYEIDRIKATENIVKRITILKGMLAYS